MFNVRQIAGEWTQEFLDLGKKQLMSACFKELTQVATGPKMTSRYVKVSG